MNKENQNVQIGDLLGFENEDEKFEFQKEVLSLKFVKVMEQFLSQNNFPRKDLASRMGYSQSYLSQVFNAGKFVNMDFLVKFQNAIGLPFDIKLGDHNMSQMDLVYNHRYDALRNRDIYDQFYPSTERKEEYEELLEG